MGFISRICGRSQAGTGSPLGFFSLFLCEGISFIKLVPPRLPLAGSSAAVGGPPDCEFLETNSAASPESAKVSGRTAFPTLGACGEPARTPLAPRSCRGERGQGAASVSPPAVGCSQHPRTGLGASRAFPSRGDAASCVHPRDLLGLKRERKGMRGQGGVSKAGWGCSGLGAGSSWMSPTPELETRTFCWLNWAFGGAAGQGGHPRTGPRPPLMLCSVISSPCARLHLRRGVQLPSSRGGGGIVRMGRNRPSRKPSDSLGFKMTPGVCHQRLGCGARARGLIQRGALNSSQGRGCCRGQGWRRVGATRHQVCVTEGGEVEEGDEPVPGAE